MGWTAAARARLRYRQPPRLWRRSTPALISRRVARFVYQRRQRQHARGACRIGRGGADRRATMAAVLAEVSENFAAARRVLNFLTDRYLYPMRRQWFGTG